jgi:hypothetical protein
MIEFYIDTRVHLKMVFPHGPSTVRTLTLQGILSYLVGPAILICNLDVLKNATLSVLSGEGPKEGGHLSNKPKSTAATCSCPILLSLKCCSAHQLPARVSVQEGLIK